MATSVQLLGEFGFSDFWAGSFVCRVSAFDCDPFVQWLPLTACPLYLLFITSFPCLQLILIQSEFIHEPLQGYTCVLFVGVLVFRGLGWICSTVCEF